MYGMVNNAIRDLVLENHGEETWTRIHTAAEAPESFDKMEPYADAITYRLVEAASVELGAPAESIMFAFGEYWVLETAEKGYGALLRLWGSTFVDFVRNLNALHERVAETFPKLKPPSFHVEHVGPTRMRVHYQSDRPGLMPFVQGLFSGLGKRFDTEVAVTVESSRDAGAKDDIFLVDYHAVALRAAGNQ